MAEIWKDVRDHKGLYKVSNRGRVKSLKRWVSRGKSEVLIKERILSLYQPLKRQKYLAVDLCKRDKDGNRKVKKYRVHHLVLLTFIGPRPKGMDGLHKDGNPENNRKKNLYWGTPKQNADDSARHGTRLKGEDRPAAKLTEEKIQKIRRLYATREYSFADLAKRYKVDNALISRIVKGTAWTHVK